MPFEQLSAVDDRYDIWRCAECGFEKHIRSVPHDPPRHCGKGMWFLSTYHSVPYLIEQKERRP